MKKAVCPHSIDILVKDTTRIDNKHESLVKDLDLAVKKRIILTKLQNHLGPNGIQSYLLENTTKRLCHLITTITNDNSFKMVHTDNRRGHRDKLYKTSMHTPELYT